MAEIVVSNLRKEFGSFVAVEDSSFTVRDGEFFVMLGPSGCGKTTTLRMIAGLELPSSGAIHLGGRDVTYLRARERDIAFVFQLFALYPHMNVRRNMAFPLISMGLPKAEIRTRVEEAARLLQIDHILDSSVSGLAGGDRQRVALGRAIVRRPDCFLMDEPLGTLDTEFRDVMTEELRGLHERINATTVYVTHDQLEAMSMADKIAVMNHGVIEQFGAPRDIYDRPATMFVADFIGSPPMNFVPLDWTGADARIGGEPIALAPLHDASAGARDLVLGVRPEGVRLDGDSPLRAKVYGTEYLGTNQIVTLETELAGETAGPDGVGTSSRGRIKARVPADTRARVGDTVGFHIDPGNAIPFNRRTGRALRTDLTAAILDANPVPERRPARMEAA